MPSESESAEVAAEPERDILFTEVLTCNIISWSSNGTYLAQILGHRILIRNVKNSFDVLATFSFPEKIDQIQWSPDSHYLSVVSFRHGILQVYAINDPEWKCSIKLSDKLVGFGEVQWSPLNRFILTTDIDYIQLTIWSLCEKRVNYVRDILPVKNYNCFSSSGRELAIARFDENLATKISIFDTKKWKLINEFPTIVQDFNGLKWSPCDNSFLCIWDSPLFSHLYIYNPSDGALLRDFSDQSIKLGIQSIVIPPSSSHLILFTSHPNTLTVLNGITFGKLLQDQCDAALPTEYNSSSSSTTITNNIIFRVESLREPRYRHETDLPYLEKKEKTQNQNQGLYKSKIKISSNEAYFAVWTELFPKVLWIYSITQLILMEVLVQKNPITSFDWEPCENSVDTDTDTKQRLAISTGSNVIYFWTPKYAFAQELPESDFKAQNVQWNSKGILSILSLKQSKLLIAKL